MISSQKSLAINSKIFKLLVIISLILTYALVPSARAMPNPWIECNNDISCGEKKAGFKFPLKVKNYTVRAMNDMIEFRFPLKDHRNVIVRKSTMPDGEPDENGIIDISGDYTNYPINETVSLSNGVKFSVRGEENNYKVVSFAAETGYYSIMCDDGLNFSDLEYFYKLLEETEAPKYREE